MPTTVVPCRRDIGKKMKRAVRRLIAWRGPFAPTQLPSQDEDAACPSNGEAREDGDQAEAP
jgi:hypothetical protein